MHVLIAAVVGLLVGAVCGYAFRGYISRKKTAAGAAIQSGLGAVSKKL